MYSILKMKGVAWGALVLIVVWLVLVLKTPALWWCYIAPFFAFMMVFCHLAALYLNKVSNVASRKLDLIALIMGVLSIIAVIVVAFIG